jgi:lipopolysaccharide biosynthesis protein
MIVRALVHCKVLDDEYDYIVPFETKLEHQRGEWLEHCWRSQLLRYLFKSKMRIIEITDINVKYIEN